MENKKTFEKLVKQREELVDKYFFEKDKPQSYIVERDKIDVEIKKVIKENKNE
jgi:hypothetical protein